MMPDTKCRFSPLFWLLFAGAIVVSMFIHEVGHCAVAWLHGFPAIPTAAKEYILRPLPEAVQCRVSLGGILGSVVAVLIAASFLVLRPTMISSSSLAGAMSVPGVYTLRFMLAGRGHDGAEFQQAQAALGFAYAGHAVDWLFAGLFVTAAALWFWRTRPRLTPRLAGTLLGGAVMALTVVVVLQSVNNAIFDPLFEPKSAEEPSRSAAPHAQKEATP